jgi:hypothetical protein
MQEYPYLNPVVLTDANFILHGGHTGTSSAAQRQIAYRLAEEQMTEYLHSFLIPPIVTGTYLFLGNPINLDYGHINQVLSVTISSVDWANSCTIDTVSGCFGQRNDEYGYLDVNYYYSCGGCSGIVGLAPYHVQVAYQSGLQTGTSNQPAMLMALTIAAQINLNEMDVSLSNEGTADIGIESFSNQQYTEKRVKSGLGSTAFGNSPMANRAARLVRKYRSKPSIGFH